MMIHVRSKLVCLRKMFFLDWNAPLCVAFGLIPLPGALTNMHGWIAFPGRS